MANLIIKSSADNLVLQGSDASPAITVGATGTTTFAENMTLSGTANNLGTISSATTFPAGHIIKTHKLTYRITSTQNIALSNSNSVVTYSSPGGAMEITGITATQGNLLHISSYGGTPFANEDGSYATELGFSVDSEEHSQFHGFNYGSGTGKYGFWNGHVAMVYTVPANFTNKTISLRARKEGGSALQQIRAIADLVHTTLWMLVHEIQQ